VARALSHACVYFAYGGLVGDCGICRGWVLSANQESAPGGALILITDEVPSANEGGIWAPSARRSTVPGISSRDRERQLGFVRLRECVI
jgi:hypothetical protein